MVHCLLCRLDWMLQASLRLPEAAMNPERLGATCIDSVNGKPVNAVTTVCTTASLYLCRIFILPTE